MAHLNGVDARLVKLKSQDGVMELAEHCQVGDAYTVYPETVSVRIYGHTDHPGIVFHRQCVMTVSPHGGYGWMPTEFFDLWNRDIH